MDPEKTLTFCQGLKAVEMTMSLQGLDGTEAATVTVTQKDKTMGSMNKVVKFLGSSGGQPVVSPKYCPGVNNTPGYLCESGHCCGDSGCCTNYSELWWFWLMLTVVILFSCFYAYRHRRTKLRIQQQQRQREINLIAYSGACSYPTSMLDLSFLSSFKLPSYEEVAAQPCTPPPPYSSVFALQGVALGGPSSSYHPHLHPHSHPRPHTPYPGPGPVRSTMTSSQSSDNYTSCSCDSCSLTSPSSASFSVQMTDETYDSSRVSSPGDGGGGARAFLARPRASLHGRIFSPATSPPAPAPPLHPPPDLIPEAAAPDVIPRCSPNPSEEGSSPPAAGLSFPLPRPPHPPRLPLSPLILSPSLTSPPLHPLLLSSDPLGVDHRVSSSSLSSSSHRLLPAHPQLVPKHALFFSGNVDFFQRRERKQGGKEAGQGEEAEEEEDAEEEEEDEEDEEEDHFRHRRLTGDSGIEVCRCHVKRGGEERAEERLEKGGKGGGEREGKDSGDCSQRAPAAGKAVITVETS